MPMPEGALSAIEKQGSVRRSVKDLHEKFRRCSQNLSGLKDITYWHPDLGVWGHFRLWKRKDGSDRYWNAFGTVPHLPRKNIIVEINPPPKARFRNMQGVLARTNDGTRWLFHKGRMSIPGRIITEDDFAAITKLSSCTVTYSDQQSTECYPVANIDAKPRTLQRQIGSFVLECQRIRLHYQFGKEVAERERRILEAEARSPELTDSYHVGPRGAQKIQRRHGKVWHALTKAVNSAGRKHTNQRVSGWDPDLRTCDDKTPVLFKIKVKITAADLQTAVGQLFLYEQLLDEDYRKVLVISEQLSRALASAVEHLGIEILTFQVRNNAVRIDQVALKRLIR